MQLGIMAAQVLGNEDENVIPSQVVGATESFLMNMQPPRLI